MGRLVVKRSMESLVRNSFTLHPPSIFMAYHVRETLGAVGIRHALSLLVIANMGSNYEDSEDSMANAAQDVLIDAKILDTASRQSGCYFDDLCRACQDFTWNQIFLAVDRVSRRNQVRLTLNEKGRYRLALPFQIGE